MADAENERKDDADETEAPTMDVYPMEEARAQLGRLVDRARYGSERLVISKAGEPAAAVVSLADLERLRAMEKAS